jgi:HlyD family secretion protein
MNSIFRKASLEKLSSPEQIDRLVPLTSSRSWMGIVFVSIILIALVVWGVLGNIPKKYQGQGVMMSSGGTVTIQSKMTGIISDIGVDKGDIIYKGQIIARIDQSDVVEEIEKLEKELKQLKNKNQLAYGSKITEQTLEIAKQNEEIKKQNIEILEALEDKKVYESDLSKKEEAVVNNKILLDAGAISIEVYDDSILERDQAKRSRDGAIAVYEQAIRNKEYLDIELEQLIKTKEALEKELLDNPDEEDLYAKIEDYKNQLSKGDIYSTVDGKVLKINTDKYNIVQPGSGIVTVLEKGVDVNETSILFYLPIEQGKRILPGMSVNVYPSTINRQEYGHMKAIITKVSEYAITTDEIKETLGSDELANKFMQMGVLVEINANLLKDENTRSGFYWSGKKGRDVVVNEGTICDVSVTIEENRPISLVIPLLKEKLLP